VRTVHVFVALADNEQQGIVPVPAKLGNGEDPEHNLDWGSAFGVRAFFSRSADWARVKCGEKPKDEVLERRVFKHRSGKAYLDAYRGTEIRYAIVDFLDASSGDGTEVLDLPGETGQVRLAIDGGANLVAYVGHDGLMDFRLSKFPQKNHDIHRDALVLACASKQYFADAVRATGAYPLLWTTGLMAPEAYTLKGALEGWVAGEKSEEMRDRAASAYDQYQRCGLRAAHRLLASGW
jgi:hypothetical protein